MVVEKKVVPVRLILKCDECGEEMVANMCFTSAPPKYEYVCPKCGATEICSILYPCIEYHEID